jgi:hypothetical protein
MWHDRRWHIERIEKTWIVETGWWNDDLYVSRCYRRVVAEDRLFDLCFDRRRKCWFVDRVLN